MDDRRVVSRFTYWFPLRFAILGAACVLGPLCAEASSPEVPRVALHPIAAVWNAQISCTPVTVARTRHPDEASVIASGQLELPETPYTFHLPALHGYGDAVLTVVKDQSRGVQDHYVLVAADELSPPYAAVVVTELPESLSSATTAAVLDSVEQSQRHNARHVHALMSPSFRRTSDDTGESLHMFMVGRRGSHCFPTSPAQTIQLGEQATIGISRFIVDGPYLIELTLIVTPPLILGMDHVGYAESVFRDFSMTISRARVGEPVPTAKRAAAQRETSATDRPLD